jgi:hypothetical protein
MPRNLLASGCFDSASALLHEADAPLSMTMPASVARDDGCLDITVAVEHVAEDLLQS